MNMKRMRGRNNRPTNNGGGGGFRNQQNGIPLNRNHVFDSSGPEMRIRGTAQQLHEKYTQMGRDASSNGDRVTGEAYYQHAEHYFRIISAINQAQNSGNQGHQPQNSGNGANGYQNNDQQRGETLNGNGDGEAAGEPRYQYENRQSEQRYQEPRYQEARPQEPRYQEARQQDARQPEIRSQEQRQPEARQPDRQPEARPQEPRQFEPRRNEPRNHEPRNRPDYQRTERYRAEAPVADTRIDISSALEAELAAAAAAMATPAAPAGLGGQPALAPTAVAVTAVAATAVPEARAIPIISDAPPPAETPKIARPRGRPRLAKNEPKEDAAD